MKQSRVANSSRQLLILLPLFLCALGIAQTGRAQMQWQCESPPPRPGYYTWGFTDFYKTPDDSLLYVGVYEPDSANNSSWSSALMIRPNGSKKRLPALPLNTFGSFAVWNGNLYAGGGEYLLVWGADSTWHKLDSSAVGIAELLPYKGKLMMAGGFDYNYNTDRMGRALKEYDGATMRTFPALDSVCNDYGAFSLAEFNGDLYVGGNLNPERADNERYKEIVRLSGGKWLPLQNGIPNNGLGGVRDMVVYKGSLYVAGMFDAADGAPGDCIARWDGQAWHSVANVSFPYNTAINDLAVFNDTLIAVGWFTAVNGKPTYRMARYWNGIWCTSTARIETPILGAAAFAGGLYVGGGFDSVGNTSCRGLIKITGWDDCFARALASVPTDVAAPASYTLSPNPTTGPLTVSWSATPRNAIHYIITDAIGRTVRSQSSRATKHTVSMDDLTPGLFFLTLSSPTIRETIKILKQ